MFTKELAFSLFLPSNAKIPLSLRSSKSCSPIIILHCLFGNRFGWPKIAQTIANKSNKKVFTLDARNHGESPRCEGGNFIDMANDLELFLNNQNIETCHLFGHSMGGRTAIAFALKKPSYLKSLAVVDVSPHYTPKNMNDVVQTMVTDFKDIFDNLSSNMTENEARIFSEKYIESSKKLDPFTIKLMSSNIVKKNNKFICLTNIDVIAKTFVKDMFGFPQFKSQFSGPVKFFGAEKSKFLRLEDTKDIYNYFPNAKILYIPESSHQMNFHQPKLLTEEYLKFLNTICVSRL